MIIGQRRPSSALPYFGRTSWGVDDIPMYPSVPAQDFYCQPQPSLQRDESPLPAVNTSLFEQTFLDSTFGFPAGSVEPAPMSFNDFFTNLAPHTAAGSPATFDLAAMDRNISPQDLTLDCITATRLDLFENDLAGSAASWTNASAELTNSSPSSTYSGSPARSDLSLPVVAPRPQHVPTGATFDLWQGMASSCQVPEAKVAHGEVQGLSVALATQHLGVPAVAIAGLDVSSEPIHIPGFDDMLFESAFVGMDEF